MIKSMTGYGRCEQSNEEKKVLVELKSVNHRYFDLNIKMPKQFGFLEEKIKEFLARHIKRGKADVFIAIDFGDTDKSSVSLNRGFAEGYINALKDLRDIYGLKDDITVTSVARNQDVFNIEKQEQDQEEIWELLKGPLKAAADDFSAMRQREGERLKTDILARKEEALAEVNKIEERAPFIAKEYKVKLEERVRDMINGVLDENRVLTEVAIYADKASIAEEIVRLKSHFNELEIMLAESNSVGKKLDFLAQEMNREINTIGSKSNNIEISKSVVKVKTEIENIREQIQNIE